MMIWCAKSLSNGEAPYRHELPLAGFEPGTSRSEIRRANLSAMWMLLNKK